MQADPPLFLHDGSALRYRLITWQPQTPAYWCVPAIVALPDGQVLYRLAPWWLCTRDEPGGCRWCEKR